MYTENPIINNSSKRQKIEYFCAKPPNINRSILPQTLIIKSINLSNLSTLMISPNQSNLIPIPNLQRQKQKESLYRMEPPIDEITHENIISFRTIPPHLEQLHEIIELSMDISANCDRCFDILNIAFLEQDIPCHVAEVSDL